MEISDIEYNDILEELADRAVDAQVKLNDDVFQGSSWRNGKYKDNAEVTYYNEFLDELKKRYPLDKVTQEDLFNLENFKGEEARNWLKNAPGSYSPGDKAKSIEAAKFLPLLQGVAKDGESWYDMDPESLRKMGFDAGYKTGSKEGFKEYLDKIGEYQQEFDRAQNLKDFREDMGTVPYWATKLAFPTMMQEGENAIVSGEGGDESTLKKMLALDFLTNAGMFAAPGTAGSVSPWLARRPLVAGGTDALLQAFLESGRQSVGSALSDTGIEYDPAMVLAAGAAGATRPALIGTAQQLSARVPGPTAQRFARGVARATRKGDSSAMEREALERLARGYNDNLAPKWNTNMKTELVDVATGKPGEKVDFYPMLSTDATRANEYRSWANTLEKAKVLDATVEDGNGHVFIDVGKMLSNYDKPVREFQEITPAGQVRYRDITGRVPAKGENFVALGAHNADKYKSAFPARYEDLSSLTPANKWGLRTGKFVGDLGSRFEPTFKVNPLDPSKYTKEPDYKREEWYTNLSDEQKKVVDEAYRKKMEELSK